jgi:hypothetical protein
MSEVHDLQAHREYCLGLFANRPARGGGHADLVDNQWRAPNPLAQNGEKGCLTVVRGLL